ncbi:probable sphingosine-1-phosphate phosphatase isoform X1 [Hydra vulgaris]|uniref:probable sphingosine-1-phosphate phosphatase isoform X1 n=1 Tax=Hydra vulgaris TaxID=6087 RepID=UPI001F5EEB39|nr:probable sphingosine-1-phosphate phosphatase [Hydra vulgaris]
MYTFENIFTECITFFNRVLSCPSLYNIDIKRGMEVQDTQEWANYDEETEKELIHPEQIMKGELGNNSDDEDIGYVQAPIDALGPPGRWVRHKLLQSILYGTPVLLAIQHLRNKHVTRLMKFVSLLGCEEFYVLYICFLVWIVDMRLARLSCIAMAMGFYIANAVKNSLCLPRPPSPPVKPLENAYYTWGLPSHHSVLAVVCPWYLWFYCWMHYHLQFASLVCLFMIITAWSFNVMFCRIYNGVHSPADVITGSLIGCLIVSFMNRFDNQLDLSTMMTGQGVLLVPVYSAVLIIIHPFNEIGLAAFVETTAMVSSMVGVVLGRAASYGRSAPLKSLMEMYKYGKTPIMSAVAVGVCRFVLGILVVLVTRVVLKIVIQTVIEVLLKLTDIRYYSKSKTSVYYTGFSKNYRLPPIWHNKKKENDDDQDVRLRNISQLKQQEPWNISHVVRFFNYIGLGFVVYYGNPVLYQYLGLVL